jgi:hypothetical protein
MRAGVRFVIANPPAPRVGDLQAALRTGFVERLQFGSWQLAVGLWKLENLEIGLWQLGIDVRPL